MTNHPGGLTQEVETEVAQRIEAGVVAAAALAGDWSSVSMPSASTGELEAVRSDGEAARGQFVTANLGLARAVARREARRCAMPEAELFQEGCVALVQAVARFDHRRGVRFSTFAMRLIMSAVDRATAMRLGELNVPRWRALALRQARGVEVELALRLGRSPALSEIAEELERPVGWVAELLSHRAPQQLGDQVQPIDARATAAFDQVVTAVDPLAWRVLTEVQREVITLRFGLRDTDTHSRPEVARRLGLGVSQVRTAEQHALQTLRRHYLDQAA